MPAPEDTKTTTEEWYRLYYEKHGSLRNSLLHNPEVLFQTLAQDRSVIRAIGSTDVNPGTARVLDVGCGGGSSLINFLRLGFLPNNLWGIDILDSRLHAARLKYPNVNFVCGDASTMEFEEHKFAIVFESTMFVQITDNMLSEKIAAEMVRVTKTGGWLILSDWRYSKPFDSTYVALSRKRIGSLFGIGSQTRLQAVFNGPLVPPIGRFLSKNIPSLYFLVQTLFPFLAGEQVTILQKN